MEKSFAFIKAHPLPFIGLFVVVLVLIVFSMRKKTSDAVSTMVIGGPSDAQVNANAAIAAASIEQQASANMAAAQVEIARSNNASAVALGGLSADLGKTQIGADVTLGLRAADVDMAVLETQKSLGLAEINTTGLVAMEQIKNDFNIKNIALTNAAQLESARQARNYYLLSDGKSALPN